ncbi:MAG: hypothetical protein KDD66_00975 [Bdellovibrionales bacterium]|nr:hypothetical protein [Bdellovibrionales bacterium]
MNTGIVRRACFGVLLLAPFLTTLGCASAEKWVNRQIGYAMSSKATKLAADRDEASEEVQGRVAQLRADEMALGVQEGTPAWYENRRSEGQAVIDQYAPVIADYKAYRDELISDSNRSKEDSQTLLQITADMAQIYQKVADFNAGWKLIEASAVENGITGLALKAPAGSEYLLELDSVNSAPGFATVNLASLPAPSGAPTPSNENYVRSGIDGVNQTNAEINNANGRMQEAQRTWDTILGITGNR